jgi:hypothetical protein
VRDPGPSLRGLRLSQLPSLGQEPLRARWRYPSFHALDARADCYEKAGVAHDTPAPSAWRPKSLRLKQ